METYQGESNRILVQIKDMDGIVIDPSVAVLHDLHIFIIHRVSFEVIAKYSKLPTTGFSPVNYVSEPIPNVDFKVECILESTHTTEAQQGLYEIQVDGYFANTKFKSGYQLVTWKGILMNINPATNG